MMPLRAAAVATAVIALSWTNVACEEQAVTPQKASAQPISTADLPTLRDAFNANADGARLVVFFSSACHACDEGSQLLEQMLASLPGDVTVFAVWEPIESKDPPPPAKWLANLKDARVRQLWDPTHLFSTEMRRAELAHPGSVEQARLRMDKNPDGILYDTAVVFAPGTRWEATLPAPVYFDGGLAAVLPALRERLAAIQRAG